MIYIPFQLKLSNQLTFVDAVAMELLLISFWYTALFILLSFIETHSD